MISIKYDNKDAVLTFPKRLISKEYVQEFIERLNVEMILKKSSLKEKDITVLAENIKADWWKKNKQKCLGKRKNLRRW